MDPRMFSRAEESHRVLLTELEVVLDHICLQSSDKPCSRLREGSWQAADLGLCDPDEI